MIKPSQWIKHLSKTKTIPILSGISIVCLVLLLGIGLTACSQQITIRPLASDQSQANQATSAPSSTKPSQDTENPSEASQERPTSDPNTEQSEDTNMTSDQVSQNPNLGEITAPAGYQVADTATDLVCIHMDSGADIVLKLRPDAAPQSVANFQKLVGQGFYDKLIFHRVIDGFMIQGGDPDGTGRGGSKETIKGEFSANGVDNPLSHKRGVLSMARSQNPNSASSQFFICNGNSEFLDGNYAAFGEVLSGMEEVDRIAKLDKDANDRPVDPPHMQVVYFLSEGK